jgi:hypothetical protein
MAGLLDRDEDLTEWLARQHAPPDPVTAGFEKSFSPAVQARINAEIQPGYRDAKMGEVPGSITPSGTLSLGPLSLSGGLQLQQALNPDTGTPYTQVKPTVGAGLKVPLPGDATGEAKFNYTPEQLLAIEAAYRRKILGGDLDVTLRHTRPYQGVPDTYGGLRWSRRF